MSVGRREQVQLALLTIVAVLAAGVVIGALYCLVTLPLAPYAPLKVEGWVLALVTMVCIAALGVGLGHERMRLSFIATAGVAVVAAAVYGGLLALPAFTEYSTNAVGLVNYALTEATFAGFIVLVIAFPAMILGLVISYWWADR